MYPAREFYGELIRKKKVRDEWELKLKSSLSYYERMVLAREFGRAYNVISNYVTLLRKAELSGVFSPEDVRGRIAAQAEILKKARQRMLIFYITGEFILRKMAQLVQRH
jgi:hypothetical protein